MVSILLYRVLRQYTKKTETHTPSHRDLSVNPRVVMTGRTKKFSCLALIFIVVESIPLLQLSRKN